MILQITPKLLAYLVPIGDAILCPFIASSGLPLSRSLGPLLFIIYINNILGGLTQSSLFVQPQSTLFTLVV